MKRSEGLLLGVLILGLVAVLVYKEIRPAKAPETAAEVPVAMPTVASKPAAERPAPLAVTANTSVETAANPAPGVSQRFAQELKALGTCLQMHNSSSNSEEPTIGALNASLHSEMGDLTAQADDWMNTHVTLPNGEKRRIRIEIEGNGEESVVRRLKYYGVDKEDLPIVMPLPEEQSVNPSDALIASLENEGQVTLREKGVHGVYASGNEIYYTERNGYLTDIELSRNGKVFKCSSLDEMTSQCKCF